MHRLALPLAMAAALAACGGGNRSQPSPGNDLPSVDTDGVARFASGPILTACTRQPINAATRARCGCVQAAANLTLSASDQQRGARFFEDPEVLQAMKLSDTPANERFWDRWERFAETAESMCRGPIS
jgi:hypothetical protein